MTSYGEKLKKAVIDKAERKILEVRNEVAKRLILIAIDRSPVWSGTYVNAHTFEIDGVPLTRPFIYPEADYYPDPDARPPYVEQMRRQLLAIQRAESVLIPSVYEAPIGSKISMFIDTSIVPWAEDYVEEEYSIYTRVSSLVEIALGIISGEIDIKNFSDDDYMINNPVLNYSDRFSSSLNKLSKIDVSGNDIEERIEGYSSMIREQFKKD